MTHDFAWDNIQMRQNKIKHKNGILTCLSFVCYRFDVLVECTQLCSFLTIIYSSLIDLVKIFNKVIINVNSMNELIINV